jgi:hypothetical protein
MTNETTTLLYTIETVYVPHPRENRRFWAKIIRATDTLPTLHTGYVAAGELPGEYLRAEQDVVLFPGDVIIRSEEVSSRKNRGWNTEIEYVCRDKEGKLFACSHEADDNKEVKQNLSEKGRKDLCQGAGDNATALRLAHAIRLGVVSI